MVRILLVFIHGFRGSETTFEDFPEQLRTTLSQILPEAHINLAVYPKFETSGNLSLAVDNLVAWLEDIEFHRRKQPNGEDELYTLLFGHSMGGILGAEAIRTYLSEQNKLNEENLKGGVLKRNRLPHMVGLVAFETPFYGLNPTMIARNAYQKATDLSTKFGSLATKLLTKPNTRSTATSEANPMTGLAIGGLALAAVAAGAFLYKDEASAAYTKFMGHMEFVNALNRPEELAQRVRTLDLEPSILFHCFYVETAVGESSFSKFILLPGEGGIPKLSTNRFTPIRYKCADEIQGHIKMFNPKINDQYYNLAQQVVQLINTFIQSHLVPDLD